MVSAMKTEKRGEGKQISQSNLAHIEMKMTGGTPEVRSVKINLNDF